VHLCYFLLSLPAIIGYPTKPLRRANKKRIPPLGERGRKKSKTSPTNITRPAEADFIRYALSSHNFIREEESFSGRCVAPKMSGAAAQYEERGGLLRPLHAHTNTFSVGAPAQLNPTTSTTTTITEHDYRFPRRPGDQGSTATSRSGTKDSSASSNVKLDFSAESNARKELLRESFFPSWKEDAANDELDSPDEMQRKDPLATQIWRLYSKTKKQLPNQERMENLTWRMMAMSLRKRKQEEAVR